MTVPDKTLVHICTAEQWQQAQRSGERLPETFGADGFVHLSTTEQVHLPANRLFAGRTDLVLLYLEPERFGAEVRWEPGVPTDPESMRFPHLYGPLPVAAVAEVRAYLPGPDGVFGPPER
ncbi:DUF952 domain-containing protein [Rhodococcus sp. NPDC058514]|uniref:DUF952 domain-containing protein n=1 Tax=unclassified Rhodococcus (in: high G+C Gram-positive bacteria) TaxID=192944 RepID=UPI003651B28F